MNRYDEMKARHQQTFRKWTPGKMFFAFSKGQLADGMRELGLDPEKDLSDGREHVGIRNVRERVQKMCGGSLSITSRKGEGTTAVIRIPK